MVDLFGLLPRLELELVDRRLDLLGGPLRQPGGVVDVVGRGLARGSLRGLRDREERPGLELELDLTAELRLVLGPCVGDLGLALDGVLDSLVGHERGDREDRGDDRHDERRVARRVVALVMGVM